MRFLVLLFLLAGCASDPHFMNYISTSDPEVDWASLRSGSKCIYLFDKNQAQQFGAIGTTASALSSDRSGSVSGPLQGQVAIYDIAKDANIKKIVSVDIKEENWLFFRIRCMQVHGR